MTKKGIISGIAVLYRLEGYFMKRLFLFSFVFFVIMWNGLFAQTPDETYTYKIGDTGPAGGIIFYVNPDPDAGTWKYLEAAPAETEKMASFFINYSSRKDSQVGSNLNTEQALGTGKKNTALILSHLASIGQWDMAVQVYDELEVNGYDDWYMPSFLELSLMYGNLHRKGLGNFKSEVYYSSSLVSRDWSWAGLPMSFNFADGSSGPYYTEGAKPVRAIRQF
jgi:hypothetical protein